MELRRLQISINHSAQMFNASVEISVGEKVLRGAGASSKDARQAIWKSIRSALRPVKDIGDYEAKPKNELLDFANDIIQEKTKEQTTAAPQPG